MTETMANLELNTFMTSDIPEDETTTSKRPVLIGGALALVLLIASYWISGFLIDKKQGELLAELKIRQEITVAGKADVIRTWISETGQRANLLTNNPLIQLFATEVSISGSDGLTAPLQAQLPYMQNAITQFVQENNLIAAYLVDQQGRAYLASNDSPSLSKEQRAKAIAHYAQNGIGTTDARISNGQLVFDFLIPVFPAQSSVDAKGEKPTGIFVMTVLASKNLANFIKTSNLSVEGEKTRLFQKNGADYYELTPTRKPFISEIPDPAVGNDLTIFELKTLSGSSEPTYAVGVEIAGTNWVLIQTVPQVTALAPLQPYAYAIYGLSGSIFVVFISILSGIWFSLKSQNARNMASQYKELAQQINAQRRLLGSINNTVDDLISLKDGDGKYVYANPAMARFVGFPEKAIPGKTDRDLFENGAARKFLDMDATVIETGQTTSDILEIEVDGETKIVRVEKSRLLDDNSAFMGIVTVCGDITDYIMNQRQKEELGRKTISILVRMMEENDPHLAGHSYLMGKIVDKVSDIMGLAGEQKQTILTGANLSQIGKISIPAEIRTKESRLTKAEMGIMQGHVGKAEAMLREMDIHPPVVTAVSQMYERQDGTGYPQQLKGDDIDMSARILGMADILVARISPRTYREAISVEEAMEVFRSNPEKYDPEVVQAFDDFLGSHAGNAFKEQLDKITQP